MKAGLTFAAFLLVSATCDAAPKRLALLVGIDHYRYPGVARLNGCVNDIEGFRDLLIRKFDFASADIVMLTNEQAGREAILDAFRSRLIDKASAGDEVVFYYAGHGSTIRDATRASGHEQTIVPWDSRDPEGQVFDITDRELRALFGELKLKTNNITAILDSCHSGTAIRAATARSIPEDARPQPRERGAATTAGPEDRGIVFIAGSRADRVSFEHFAEGSAHGALSWFLARELSSAGPETTWRDVMERVSALVSALYPQQEPQMEGAAADKPILGGALSVSQPHYLVSPRGDADTTLNAGSIQGVGAGSVFDVFRAGTRDFVQSTPVARIQVTRAAAFNSDAHIVSGGPVAAGSPAVERQRQYGDFTFRVYLENPGSSKVLSAAGDALGRETFVEISKDPARADMLIRITKEGIVTSASDGTPLSPALNAAAPDTLATLIERIRSWAKWYRLLTLDNPNSRPLVSLRVDPVAPRPDGRILSGDKLRVVMANSSPSAIFVSLLDLARTGSISVVPLTVEGASEQIAPGSELTSVIEAFVPEGQTSATDYLKIFATTTAIDFRMLTTGNIRDAPSATDPLTRLFASALTGATRGIRPVNVTDWAAATRQITVLRP